MSDSLMDSAGATPPATDAGSAGTAGSSQAPSSTPSGDSSVPATTTPPAAWYYDENMPGNGDRPEWLKEKYKTAADQAKAYTDLEKRLGAFKGAPEGDYDLTIDGDEYKGVTFDKENPVLQEFLADAKNNGVSQEYVTNMLKSYAKMQLMQQPNFDRELEKLGANGKQDLQLLLQWGSNNFSKEELETFKGMVRSAEDVRLFEKVRRLMTKADTQPSNTKTHAESPEKIKQMIHDPRYEMDEVFRNEVRAKMAQVLGE